MEGLVLISYWYTFRNSLIEPAILAVLLMLLGHHLYVLRFHVGAVPIAPQEFAFLVVFSIGVLMFPRLKSTIRISKLFIWASILLLLFTLWVGLGTLWAPTSGAFITLAAQVRSLVLFVVLGLLVSTLFDLRRLNEAVFLFGVGVAALSVILHISALGPWAGTSLSDYLLKHHIGAMLHLNIPRLTGLARDPNFYSLWLVPPFFVGLAGRQLPLKWLGVGLIALAILLAASRSVLLLLLVIGVILTPLLLSRVGRLTIVTTYLRRFAMSVLVAGALAAALFGATLAPTPVWEVIDSRFDMGPQNRLGVLSITRAYVTDESPTDGDHQGQVYRQEGEGRVTPPDGQEGAGRVKPPDERNLSIASIIFGRGPRAIRESTGIYSHNSFVDLAVETGVTGLVLWTAFVGLVTITAMKNLSNRQIFPWFQTWLVLIGMHLTYSLITNPFFSLVAAVVIGAAAVAGGSEESGANAGQSHSTDEKPGLFTT